MTATTRKTKATRKAKAPITADMKIVVLKKENPFREGTVQAKKGDLLLKSNGKLVGEVRKHKLIDSWAVRECVRRGVIRVVAA